MLLKELEEASEPARVSILLLEWFFDCCICCCLLAWKAINFAWTPGWIPMFLIAFEAEEDLDKPSKF